MKRRMLPMLLSLALCLALLPTGALAAESVSYVYYEWNGTGLVKYENTATVTEVTANTTTWGDGGWYIARGEVTINGRVTVNGSAQLILEDGCKLTVTQGIQVGRNCHLTIYGQSEGTGTLVANGVLGNPAAPI